MIAQLGIPDMKIPIAYALSYPERLPVKAPALDLFSQQKLTFFPIHRDTVRQLFETSTDSGRTWQPGFDGRYVRHR